MADTTALPWLAQRHAVGRRANAMVFRLGKVGADGKRAAGHFVQPSINCGPRLIMAELYYVVLCSAEDTFVNIGARDGVHEDPLHPLLSNPADVRFAFAVEMHLELFVCM